MVNVKAIMIILIVLSKLKIRCNYFLYHCKNRILFDVSGCNGQLLRINLHLKSKSSFKSQLTNLLTIPQTFTQPCT